jgi:hypothetical protein
MLSSADVTTAGCRRQYAKRSNLSVDKRAESVGFAQTAALAPRTEHISVVAQVFQDRRALVKQNVSPSG